jgi:hypothetical protein
MNKKKKVEDMMDGPQGNKAEGTDMVLRLVVDNELAAALRRASIGARANRRDDVVGVDDLVMQLHPGRLAQAAQRIEDQRAEQAALAEERAGL